MKVSPQIFKNNEQFYRRLLNVEELKPRSVKKNWRKNARNPRSSRNSLTGNKWNKLFKKVSKRCRECKVRMILWHRSTKMVWSKKTLMEDLKWFRMFWNSSNSRRTGVKQSGGKISSPTLTRILVLIWIYKKAILSEFRHFRNLVSETYLCRFHVNSNFLLSIVKSQFQRLVQDTVSKFFPGISEDGLETYRDVLRTVEPKDGRTDWILGFFRNLIRIHQFN